jgi:arylsulfotransferase ASST
MRPTWPAVGSMARTWLAVGSMAACLAAISICGCGKSSYRATRSSEPQADVSGAAANPATVSPLPGTPDASPQTQISFLGARGMRVSDVQVVGSRSGAHTGVLRAFSTGTGESFLPAQPFSPGEHVSVRARVRKGRRSREASTSFAVAAQATVSKIPFPHVAGDARAVQGFLSAPAVTPSTVTVTTPAQPGASPGDLFLAPYQGAGSPGPMIIDQTGGLVWFHPLAAGEQATNFGVQRYRGRPVLVWWQGRIIQAGFGEGEDVIYDSSYRRLASVRGGNGYAADLHAIRLTAQGTAWIDAFDPVETDLSAVNGPRRGILTDSVVQEVDVQTGLVMWEWHALGHLPLEESQVPVAEGGYPWDYAHVNSVDPGSAGDVLLSARSTSALYDVDIHSGGVRWRAGGRSSSFALGPGAAFYWQHDAELQAGGQISLFDNGSEPPREKQSRGLLLSVHPGTRTVSLVREFTNPTHALLSPSQGSMKRLHGGNWLVGYGRLPQLTEFGPDGRVLLDATLGADVQDYSADLSRWDGRPLTQPSLVVQRLPGNRRAVRVSWNGATEVARWRILAGASPAELSPADLAPRTGFETTISTRASGRYLSVQALDRAGAVIGASRVVAG